MVLDDENTFINRVNPMDVVNVIDYKRSVYFLWNLFFKLVLTAINSLNKIL